jgi:glycerol-3-phosphate dehydrogenase
MAISTQRPPPKGGAEFDVAVIGAGVVGCAVFRALTLAGLSVILLERSADILDGASKGNSAILHTGFDAPPGSREVQMMQAGRKRYLAERALLGLPILQTDAMLVAWSEEEAARLPAIVDKAHRNGVTDVRPIELDALRRRMPTLASSAIAALSVPGEHIIDPWSSPLAYALQAIAHGGVVERLFDVDTAERLAGIWRLSAGKRAVDASIAINCAGNYGDHVEALSRPSPFAIRPRKGQFVVFDKTARRHVPTILLPVPTERTKGVVVCPTVFGNVLVGPTAEDQDGRGVATVERSTLEHLIGEAARMVPALADEPVNATYAGLRPAGDQKDYIIEAISERHWVTVAGIRSTGLTAALGIADYVTELVEEHFLPLRPLRDLIWPSPPNLAEHLPRDHERPGRGDIICLCELVTKDEILAALAGPLPAGNLGGLKRRTRAMMGRCQGFNCLAAVCEMANDKLLEAPPLPRGTGIDA